MLISPLNDLQTPIHVINQAHVVTPQGQTIPWSHGVTGLDKLHALGFTGKGIKVAVIDTGIDFYHPDLAGASMTIDKPETSNTSGQEFSASNGHGTAVAGVLGARNNNEGVLGAAPMCDIIPVKAMKESQGASYENISRAIERAAIAGAQIINLSLGGPKPDLNLSDVITEMIGHGIIFVVAAGNTGRDDNVMFPGSMDGVFCVGASDKHNRVSAFSSRGWQVDVTAPGERILTTHKNQTYSIVSGTSFAAPFVSGAFACLLQAGITPTLDMMATTSIDIEEEGIDPRSGNGLINPYGIYEKYRSGVGISEEKPVLSTKEKVVAGLDKIKEGVTMIAEAIDIV